MYADDGVFIHKETPGSYDESMKDFVQWQGCLNRTGVELEPSKSGLKKETFKFLGIEFNIKERTLEIMGQRLS